jgi:hypothetical protein
MDASKRLLELEAVIASGQQTFVEVGNALAEIRDARLYRLEHGTFEAYCKAKWGWTASRARQICIASEVVQTVTAGNALNERQARELSKVPEGHRAEVLQAVVETGAITARRIGQVAQRLTMPPAIMRDKEGWAIPTQLVRLWQSATEVQEKLTALSHIKADMKRAQDENRQLYRHVSYGAVIAALDQARTEIEIAKPYAVCTACQGQLPDHCLLCKGVGFISKFAWDNIVSREDKEFRFKARAGGGQ